MNTSETTISVNPANVTLGSKAENAYKKSYLRTNIRNNESSCCFATLSELFLSEKMSNSQIRSINVPLRCVFSAILIITGIYSINANIVWPGIVEILIGSCLALGFLSKIAMAIGTTIFTITGIISMRAGMPDMEAFTLAFGCAMFFFYGAGKYSLDAQIKHYLKSLRSKRIERANKNDLTYKAFSKNL